MSPMSQQIPKTTTSTATIVEPTGVPVRMDISMPAREDTTDRIAESIVTCLKLRKILIADRAGKITSADMSNDPTRFIASTMITAMMTAIRRL